MSKHDHERLTRLFEEASALEPTERARFLDRACAGEPELRAEIESLLAQEGRIPDILRKGFDRGLDWAPSRVGSFNLLKKIGEGGMGVVYLAEQREPIRRRAAVKLIRLGLETAQVVARFESERQALALMNHRNVAGVYEAGTTEQGRLYFAMEYVEGEPITDYCDKRKLTVRERLDLFRQVCEGVQHAHQNAIIHRDIKPSNVLVTVQDGKPVPKIIDFGVAKATARGFASRGPATEAGQLVGTPEYMSPEQAELNDRNVDTRTDVYSLGILLYELLTGALPFAARDPEISLDEIRRRIREDEPSRPSARIRGSLDTATNVARDRRTVPTALARRLRGDLDWITLRALEKDRDRRYASPSELRADIDRHLAREPVQAGPAHLSYRVGRFARKHRAGVSFAATLVILLATFAITGTLQASRIAREAAVAEQMSEFILGMFQDSSDPGLRGRAQFRLDQVLHRVDESIRRELVERPVFLARLRHVIGLSYAGLGQQEKAEPLLENSVQKLRQTLGTADPITLNAMDSLAKLSMHQGRFERAEALFREVRATRDRLLGPEHDESLRSSIALAFLYKQWGRSHEAQTLFEETLPILESRLGPDHPELLVGRGFLVGVAMDQGHYDTLVPVLTDLLERMEAVLGREHAEFHAALYNLACVQANLGRRDEALANLREVLDLGFDLGMELPADPHLKPLLGDTELLRIWARRHSYDPRFWRKRVAIGDRYNASRDFPRAEREYRRVINAAREAGQPEHGAAEAAGTQLWWLLYRQGRHTEARSLALEWLKHGEQQGQRNAAVANALWSLAYSHAAEGQDGEAVDLMGRAVSIYEALGGFAVEAAYSQAVHLVLLGERESALRELRRAVNLGMTDGETISQDPILAQLHGDPRFEAIVADIEALYADL